MSDERPCLLHEARIALCPALWHPLHMAVIIAFLLGIGNFAWHRAVLESGHAMMDEMSAGQLQTMRRMTLAFEYVLLCGALFAALSGTGLWVWLYAAYSLVNGGAAWLIVKRRI